MSEPETTQKNESQPLVNERCLCREQSRLHGARSLVSLAGTAQQTKRLCVPTPKPSAGNVIN